MDNNLYILLDSSDNDYDPGIIAISGVVNASFSPRHTVSGTAQAIIQIKEAYITTTTGLVGDLAPCTIGSGDVTWAQSQVSGTDWNPEEL